MECARGSHERLPVALLVGHDRTTRRNFAALDLLPPAGVDRQRNRRIRSAVSEVDGPQSSSHGIRDPSRVAFVEVTGVQAWTWRMGCRTLGQRRAVRQAEGPRVPGPAPALISRSHGRVTSSTNEIGKITFSRAGVTQLAECQLPKLN